MAKNYIDAIRKQALSMVHSGLTKGIFFNTIYIGGGTPSLLPSSHIYSLLEDLSALFPMASAGDMEITIECNPESVTSSWIKEIKEAGINRISLGIQDLSDKGLKLLGRIHTADQAIEAAKIIKNKGISNLSLDIIFCLPNQDIKWLENTLAKIISLEPAHISTYELTAEPNTRFAKMIKEGTLNLPDQEASLAMTKFLENFLHSQGFHQYEISNFSKPDMECRHNINYWTGGQYLGLGCGAVSYLHGIRYFNIKDLDSFMESATRDRRAIGQEEKLDREARFRETLVTWLRMPSGVKAKVLQKRFGIDPFSYYGPLLDKLCKNGLMEADKNSGILKLTKKGIYISNYVLSYLV